MKAWQNNSQTDLESQKTKNNHETPEEECGGGRDALLDYHKTFKAIVIELVW